MTGARTSGARRWAVRPGSQPLPHLRTLSTGSSSKTSGSYKRRHHAQTQTSSFHTAQFNLDSPEAAQAEMFRNELVRSPLPSPREEKQTHPSVASGVFGGHINPPTSQWSSASRTLAAPKNSATMYLCEAGFSVSFSQNNILQQTECHVRHQTLKGFAKM